jgi:hypothetical protein
MLAPMVACKWHDVNCSLPEAINVMTAIARSRECKCHNLTSTQRGVRTKCCGVRIGSPIKPPELRFPWPMRCVCTEVKKILKASNHEHQLNEFMSIPLPRGTLREVAKYLTYVYVYRKVEYHIFNAPDLEGVLHDVRLSTSQSGVPVGRFDGCFCPP